MALMMKVSPWVLLAGSCFGLLLGLLLGLLIGGPMALVTYGSINDAIRNNEGRDFSLDNGKTDIPGRFVRPTRNLLRAAHGP